MGSVARVFRPTPPPPSPPSPPPVAKPVATTMAPTTAEVSQSTATDADGYSSAAMSLKTKRKGRSATILTSSAGVEGDATLGKRSLLGS